MKFHRASASAPRVLLVGATLAMLVGAVTTPANAEGMPVSSVGEAQSGTMVSASSELADLTPADLNLDSDPSSLGSGWCGTPTFDDYSGNLYSNDRPQAKVVYAIPSDGEDRFIGAAGALQTAVGVMTKFVAASSGYRKTIRFDMGTSCGSQYLDIQKLKLKETTAEVKAMGGCPSAIFPEIVDIPGYRSNYDYTVVIDMGINPTVEEGCGNIRTSPNATTSGWTWSSTLESYRYSLPTFVIFHELSHNLGAVDFSSPHSSGAGHCIQAVDVMCYIDGGPNFPTTGLLQQCAQPLHNGPINSWYDCGGDDYFNPKPAAGSFLAENPESNVYRSLTLGSCTELILLCSKDLFDGVDTDGDLLENQDDECPTKAGLFSNHGCPDTDKDGSNDGVDKCPSDAGPTWNLGCPALPAPSRTAAGIGKPSAGTLVLTVTPGFSSYTARAQASVRLMRGMVRTVKVCINRLPSATPPVAATCTSQQITARSTKTFSVGTSLRMLADKLPKRLQATVEVSGPRVLTRQGSVALFVSPIARG